jgi:murein tripeptide amidase MpaA
MHGNEVLGRELLLHVASYLCERYLAGDPDIQKLINLTRIHLLPSMNPDGWQVSTETVSSNPCLKSKHTRISALAKNTFLR